MLPMWKCCQCGSVANPNVASFQLGRGGNAPPGRRLCQLAAAREHGLPPMCPRQARPLGLWRGRESGFLDAAYFAGIHLCEAEALAAKVFQRGAYEI